MGCAVRESWQKFATKLFDQFIHVRLQLTSYLWHLCYFWHLLLIGHHEEHPACKKPSSKVLAWSSSSRRTSPNFGWKMRGYLYLQHKTSDVSETKQSRAKVTTVSIQTRIWPIDWWQSSPITYGDWWTLVYFSGEQNFSTTDILHSFCRSATKFGCVRGLANWNLFPEFGKLWYKEMILGSTSKRPAITDNSWHTPGKSFCLQCLGGFYFRRPSLGNTHWVYYFKITVILLKTVETRMWANAQRDGRPAEHRWRPLFNATKFRWCPLLECRAVTLPRRETSWN